MTTLTRAFLVPFSMALLLIGTRVAEVNAWVPSPLRSSSSITCPTATSTQLAFFPSFSSPPPSDNNNDPKKASNIKNNKSASPPSQNNNKKNQKKTTPEEPEKKKIGPAGIIQLVAAGLGAPFLGEYQGVDPATGKFMFTLEANNFVDEYGNSKQTQMPYFERGWVEGEEENNTKKMSNNKKSTSPAPKKAPATKGSSSSSPPPTSSSPFQFPWQK